MRPPRRAARRLTRSCAPAARDLDLVAPRGRIAIIGSRGELSLNPRAFMAKEATAVGVMTGLAAPSEVAEGMAAVQAGLDSGWLRPVVGSEHPLTHAAAAHVDVIEHRSGAVGKVVLNCDEA